MRRWRSPGVVLLVLALFLLASVRVRVETVPAFHTLATLGWGSGPGEVGLIRTPDGRRFGPPDFIMAGGELLVLDMKNHRVVRVRSGRVLPPGEAPTGGVALAAGPDGPYIASDARETLFLGSRPAFAYPGMGDGITRTFQLLSRGGSAYLLLVHFGLGGQARGLFVVGPKGYRAVRGPVRSLALSPGGGFFWSDGARIFAPSGKVVGQSPGELVGADASGHVADLLFPGTPRQEVRIFPGDLRVPLPDPGWASLGETVQLLPDGRLVVAEAGPRGLRVRTVSLGATWSLTVNPLALFRGG